MIQPDERAARPDPDARPARGAARCRVRNADRGTVLAERAEVARSWWARGIGLMGRRALPAGSGLVIGPCSSITMAFMAFPIDVAFVSRDGRVVRAAHAVRPWLPGLFAPGAHYVVELPEGTLRRTGTQVDDHLILEPADEADELADGAPGAP